MLWVMSYGYELNSPFIYPKSSLKVHCVLIRATRGDYYSRDEDEELNSAVLQSLSVF